MQACNEGRNHKRSWELYNLASQMMTSNIPDLKKCPFTAENFKNNQALPRGWGLTVGGPHSSI